MTSRRKLLVLASVASVAWLAVVGAVRADATHCDRFCHDVGFAPGALTATHVEQGSDGNWVATNESSTAATYRYQLTDPCVIDDRNQAACRGIDFKDCPAPADRVVK